MLDFCRCGPANAKVSSVEVIWADYTGEFKDFFIRYR